MDSRSVNAGGIVAIAAALPMEVAGLRKLGNFNKAEIQGLEYLQGGIRGTEAALFVSGIGEKRAYDTARAACRALPLRAYISIGLSGSLSPSLRAGDVAVGVKVTDQSGMEFHSDRGLAGLAMEALAKDGGTGFGSLLSTNRVAFKSDEKKSLAHSCNCIALDMEAAGAARAAAEAGVPFIAMRAISDALEDDLPMDFNRFTVDGAMNWPRFILHVLTHPGTIGPLMRLGKSSRLAVANLTAVVDKVFTNL